MEREFLEQVIEQYMHRLEQGRRAIPGAFEEEEVHRFRVTYKKCRAFLRLLPKGKEMPARLEAAYHALGDVRDRALMQQKLVACLDQKGVALPAVMQQIDQQQERARRKAEKKLDKLVLAKNTRTLKKQLPHELDDAMVARFARYHMAGIQLLLMVAEEDDEFHHIRKHLKDIAHIDKLFTSEWDMPFPQPAWNDIRPLNQLADLLGDYNDQVHALLYLDQVDMTTLPQEEKEIVAQTTADWLAEKLRQKKEVIERLKMFDR